MQSTITRRTALAASAMGLLARPALVRAQGKEPIQIGVLSDVAGPYRSIGGPGAKIAVEMAVEDFGGQLLGRTVQVAQADIQNKPDVASAKAREWIDQGFNLLVDGGATSSGLAVQEVARQKKCIFIGNGPSSSDFAGKFCSPTGFHFWADTYSLARGTGDAVTRAGGKTWYFITADYQFGYSLQENTEQVIKAAGGSVLGSTRVPLGTTDFSSALIQAQASGAKVVGFANAGADLQNCIKQASEFGLAKQGQMLATLLLFITDVVSLGQEVCSGLILTNSFYWNMSAQTRAWTDRFAKRMGLPPTMIQAANYSGVLHWMRAAQAAGVLDGDIVAAKMRAMPVKDFYHDDVPIRANNQILDPMYVWRVKPPQPSAPRWDFFEPIATIPGKDAYIPLEQTACNITWER